MPIATEFMALYECHLLLLLLLGLLLLLLLLLFHRANGADRQPVGSTQHTAVRFRQLGSGPEQALSLAVVSDRTALHVRRR